VSAVLLDWYTSGPRAREEGLVFAKYYSANANEVFVNGVCTTRDVVPLDGDAPNGGGNGNLNRQGQSLLPGRTLADMSPYPC
jgi:hypothetical protein